MNLCFSNFSVHNNHLDSLLKHGLLRPIPRVSMSVGLGYALRFWISNKFSEIDDAYVAGPGTIVWELLVSWMLRTTNLSGFYKITSLLHCVSLGKIFSRGSLCLVLPEAEVIKGGESLGTTYF